MENGKICIIHRIKWTKQQSITRAASLEILTSNHNKLIIDATELSHKFTSALFNTVPNNSSILLVVTVHEEPETHQTGP